MISNILEFCFFHVLIFWICGWLSVNESGVNICLQDYHHLSYCVTFICFSPPHPPLSLFVFRRTHYTVVFFLSELHSIYLVRSCGTLASRTHELKSLFAPAVGGKTFGHPTEGVGQDSYALLTAEYLSYLGSFTHTRARKSGAPWVDHYLCTGLNVVWIFLLPLDAIWSTEMEYIYFRSR